MHKLDNGSSTGDEIWQCTQCDLNRREQALSAISQVFSNMCFVTQMFRIYL